jgi:enoyl-CoA hydratase/carnithine racemase
VHGIATAAGCQLVSMCDLAVASENATFALPGVNIGVFCSTPAVGVGRNINRKRAMEMLLTGQLFDAKTALEWGLVNKVVPLDKLDEEIDRYVQVILGRSAAVIETGKRTFYAQIDQPLGDAYETAGATMVRNLSMEDASEGMGAFLGKRAPVWREL